MQISGDGEGKNQNRQSKYAASICGEKQAYYAVVKKTDGSMGGGSNDSFFQE
jgi:hypothetical protein